MSKACAFGIHEQGVHNLPRNTNYSLSRSAHLIYMCRVEHLLNSFFYHELREIIIIYINNTSNKFLYSSNKFVPQSEYIIRIPPQSATKRRNALTNVEELISSSTSI